MEEKFPEQLAKKRFQFIFNAADRMIKANVICLMKQGQYCGEHIIMISGNRLVIDANQDNVKVKVKKREKLSHVQCIPVERNENANGHWIGFVLIQFSFTQLFCLLLEAMALSNLEKKRKT